MSKMLLCLKKIFIAFFAPTTAFTLTGAMSILIGDNKPDVVVQSIPPEYLDISSDQTTLYGFKADIAKEDIANYNTLTIPDTVTTIAPHAFWFIFDGGSNKVSNIIFNKALQTIGDGAFYCCYGIQTINFKEIQDDAELKYIGKEAFSDTEIGPDLYIPKRVEQIGERCFYNCQYITGTLSIPDSVEEIGRFAFSGSAYIETIDFTSWTNIPQFMYEKRMIFKDVGTGDDVHSDRKVKAKDIIDDFLWDDLLFQRQSLKPLREEFTGFVLDIEHHINIVPDDAFEYPQIKDPDDEEKMWTCVKFKDDFDLSKLSDYTDIVIKDGVNCIDTGVFTDKIKNCHLHIKFPSSLKAIRESAFQNCSGLYGEINLPDSVEEVQSWAFCGCSNIDTVIMGTGLEELGLTGSDKGRTFRDCYSLKTIIFGGFPSMKMGPNIFEDDYNVNVVDWTAFGAAGFPDTWWVDPPEKGNEESIKALNAFKGFPKTGRIFVDPSFFPYQKQIDFIKNVDTGMALTTFKQNAGYDDSEYWNCVPNQTFSKSFSDSLFLTDTNVSTLWTMQQEGIDNKTLYDLIEIPHTISKIADKALANIFSVTQVQQANYYWGLVLNEGLTSIGDGAFQNCINISDTLILPSTLEWIGDFAFADCAHFIGSLNIPNSVTHIGTQAFAGCNLLSDHVLSLPTNLSYIGDFAFEGTRIESIKFNSSSACTFIGSPFYGMRDLTKLDMSSVALNDIKQNWQTSQRTFVLSPAEGQIIINSTEDVNEWTQWLSSNGLPNGWTVTSPAQQHSDKQGIGGNYA